eukprot:6198141-Pleurochrysis_carterae.AAC.4
MHAAINLRTRQHLLGGISATQPVPWQHEIVGRAWVEATERPARRSCLKEKSDVSSTKAHKRELKGLLSSTGRTKKLDGAPRRMRRALDSAETKELRQVALSRQLMARHHDQTRAQTLVAAAADKKKQGV